jgi:hypothetical protein
MSPVADGGSGTNGPWCAALRGQRFVRSYPQRKVFSCRFVVSPC